MTHLVNVTTNTYYIKLRIVESIPSWFIFFYQFIFKYFSGHNSIVTPFKYEYFNN
jgi:hypothetical protein